MSHIGGGFNWSMQHLEAVDLPALYDDEGRAGKLMALLIAEIAIMPPLSLNAPVPAYPRLATCMSAYIR